MKLIRFGEPGREKPGAILPDGRRVDVSASIPDYDELFFASGGLDRLRELLDGDGASLLPQVGPDVRLGPPVARPGKIICIGLNFRDHAEESNMQLPSEPIIFFKAGSALSGPNDDIVIPKGSQKTDWEIELATIIGKPARYVAAPKAEEHVFGYTVMLDISDRGGRPQGGFSSGVDWFLMKGQETFGPMGPFIVPKEFYGNPMTDLKQTLLVGTDQRQQSDSSDMIHSVWEVIEYASSLVTLQPGDVIGAGTSGGVGMGTSVRGSQVWLVAGDEITGSIDKIGTLRHKVAAAPAPPPGTGSFLPPVTRKPGQ